MATWQAILLGAMLILTPSMLVLVWMLWFDNNGSNDNGH